MIVVDDSGKFLSWIKIEKDFKYFEPSKIGMLIFYDNFYFEDCFIDMQNHKIEIKEKF